MHLCIASLSVTAHLQEINSIVRRFLQVQTRKGQNE